MEASVEKNILDEDGGDILMWSITGVVVALLVIVTIVVLICIWRKTPPSETEIVPEAATKAKPDLKSRAVEYYHRYWKVTDSDAPRWDPTRPRTGTHTDKSIRSARELRELRREEEACELGEVDSFDRVDYFDMTSLQH